MDLVLNVPGRKYKLPVTITQDSGRLRFKYSFCVEMNAEVKAMQGAKYHGYDEVNPQKIWTVDDCPRNWFTLRYLSGHNVYENYDKPLVKFTTDKYLESWEHVREIGETIITRKRVLFAYEMGTGKTRGAQIGIDESGFSDWWWIGTKGSLREMTREWSKWKPKITPKFFTYDELKKVCTNWNSGNKAPHGVIYDEISKCKTWTAQRTQAAYHLATSIEKDWGENCFVIGMTGTPSPKDPTDWWSLCEIIKPGFIREGTVQKFKSRLCLQVKKEGQYGVYPEHVTWWDNEDKCKVCGKFEHSDPITGGNPAHSAEDAIFTGIQYHKHEKSTNEVNKLYQRMRGLVVIKFKREVMKFLPEKRYVLEELKPSSEILRAAKTIAKTAKNTITALTLLRELSDGFQYIDTPQGLDQCGYCKGFCHVTEYFDKNYPDKPVFDIPADEYDRYGSREITCPTCEGKGQVTKYIRTTKEVPCPKDDYFIDLLDNHEDVGRFVCYASFTGSIDRCCNTARKNGWAVIRVDARGWHATDYNNSIIPVSEIFDKSKGDPYLQMFQEGKNDFGRVCYIAHPKSGGMGVTLTASPGEYYFSNSFDAEDRIQSEDRIHRGGMDIVRGATVYDAIHLPTDRLILENLMQKKDLMSMTLGQVGKAMDTYFGERVT